MSGLGVWVKKLFALIAVFLVFSMSQDVSKHEIGFLSASANDGIYRIKCGKSFGTGVMISPTAMTTAAHVVGKSSSCTADINGSKVNFKVIRIEKTHDFALLETKKHISAHRTVNCGGIVNGNDYSIAGYQYGETFGVVPAKPVDLYYDIEGSGPDNLRAMKGTTYRGMSGGPVIQNDGKVAGFLVGEMYDGTKNNAVKEYRDVSLCDPR